MEGTPFLLKDNYLGRQFVPTALHTTGFLTKCSPTTFKQCKLSKSTGSISKNLKPSLTFTK